MFPEIICRLKTFRNFEVTEPETHEVMPDPGNKKGQQNPAGMVPAGILLVNYFNVTDNAILYLEGVDVLVSSMVCHVKGAFYFIDVVWRSHLISKLVIDIFVFSIHQF